MEIEFLSCLIEEEQGMKMSGGKVYEEWLDEARTLFKRFVHSLEKARRRSKKNMEMNFGIVFLWMGQVQIILLLFQMN